MPIVRIFFSLKHYLMLLLAKYQSDLLYLLFRFFFRIEKVVITMSLTSAYVIIHLASIENAEN